MTNRELAMKIIHEKTLLNTSVFNKNYFMNVLQTKKEIIKDLEESIKLTKKAIIKIKTLKLENKNDFICNCKKCIKKLK